MDVGGDSVQKGSQSFKFDIPVYIEQTASVVGEKESEGPLGRMFDVVIKDPMSGKDNYTTIVRDNSPPFKVCQKFSNLLAVKAYFFFQKGRANLWSRHRFLL